MIEKLKLIGDALEFEEQVIATGLPVYEQRRLRDYLEEIHQLELKRVRWLGVVKDLANRLKELEEGALGLVDDMKGEG